MNNTYENSMPTKGEDYDKFLIALADQWWPYEDISTESGAYVVQCEALHPMIFGPFAPGVYEVLGSEYRNACNALNFAHVFGYLVAKNPHTVKHALREMLGMFADDPLDVLDETATYLCDWLEVSAEKPFSAFPTILESLLEPTLDPSLVIYKLLNTARNQAKLDLL